MGLRFVFAAHNYKKIVDDNENELNGKIEKNEVDEKISQVKPSMAAIVKGQVQKCVVRRYHQKKTCDLLPQNCCVLKEPVTQKIVEVKSRFN